MLGGEVRVLLVAISYALASDLAVMVEGLPHPSGAVRCALYSNAEKWLKNPGPILSALARPKKGRARCAFGEVPPGDYAVAFFQDTNANGRMDYTRIGLPAEPWGVSRNAPIVLGAPRFRAAAFSHPGPQQWMSAR